MIPIAWSTVKDTYVDIFQLCTEADARFRKVKDEIESRGFPEMAFCLCTPQSKAENCWGAIVNLNPPTVECSDGFRTTPALYHGGTATISEILKDHGVRFHNTKARRIIDAREHWEKFLEGIQITQDHGESIDAEISREWLVETVDGFGMKEASHFLRNIGYGQSLAILDRHILRCLRDLETIPCVPAHLTKNRYLNIEGRMLADATRMNIPLHHLDMVLWFITHKKVFK